MPSVGEKLGIGLTRCGRISMIGGSVSPSKRVEDAILSNAPQPASVGGGGRFPFESDRRCGAHARWTRLVVAPENTQTGHARRATSGLGEEPARCVCLATTR